jgi:hypothetical protein
MPESIRFGIRFVESVVPMSAIFVPAKLSSLQRFHQAGMKGLLAVNDGAIRLDVWQN